MEAKISILWFLIIIVVGPIVYSMARDIQERFERLRIEKLLNDRDRSFNESFGKGRIWLSEFIADARNSLDIQLELQLRKKKRPAPKAADAVKEIGAQKRELIKQVKFLEYQLKSYEEYFPFLEEYRDIILNERTNLINGQDNIEQLESIDPVHLYLDQNEYDKLSTTERNQLALDRYINRTKTKWEIGRLYERYLGYLYESKGWRVNFQGAILGYEDFGRDLICTKEGKTEIVQAKCWSKDKVIREKHIFQLFGTVIHYRKLNPGNIMAVFATTTDLSIEAKDVDAALSVRIDYILLNTKYPMVKCNISSATREKIYHLPFDQQYDKVIIGDQEGECYVSKVKEAETLGFRRAFRYIDEGKGKSGKKIHTKKKNTGRRLGRA